MLDHFSASPLCFFFSTSFVNVYGRYFQALKRTALRKRCSYVDSAKAVDTGVVFTWIHMD